MININICTGMMVGRRCGDCVSLCHSFKIIEEAQIPHELKVMYIDKE